MNQGSIDHLPENSPETNQDGLFAKTVSLTPVREEIEHAENHLQEMILEQDLAGIHLTEKPRDKYKFRRSIGVGGMKMVLEVYDKDTMRNVALAMMPDIERRSKHEILQFIQEARLTASLEHPNIVPVHDIGMDSTGTPYFTMKLLHGETLASLLKRLDSNEEGYREKYTFDKLMRLYLRICSGTAFAHSKGIVHLDLKPENVQIGEFSEVLILDWGIARYIGPRSSDTSSSQKGGGKKKIASFRVGVEDSMKGTPGYMAPEQITGKEELIGVRTDIYALGAILYAMVTYKSPASDSSIKKILQNTIFGNIIRPSLRTPRQNIPYGIEAVIMKAMSTNPENRYRSVTELRDDVSAFIDGFATTAERASFFKKGVLFFRRHIVLTISLMLTFVLLLGIGTYAAMEIPRWKSGWIEVMNTCLDGKDPDLSRMEFRDFSLRKKVKPWELQPGAGLIAREGEWLILKPKIRGNVKLVITAAFPSVLDSLEIYLNARLDKPVSEWWQSPDSYSFRIAESDGEKDAIVKNNIGRRIQQEYIAASETRVKPNTVITITAEHVDEQLTLQVENQEPVRAADFFPLMGKGLDGIGIRSGAGPVRILNLTLYRLALPEKTTPLVAGDTLAELQLYSQAIGKYLSIAENYGESKLAEKALLKAYLTAASRILDPKERTACLLEIKRLIISKFPHFKYMRKILECDAGILWREGRHHEALMLAEQVLEMKPDSNIMADILCLPHHPIAPDAVGDFFALLRKSKNLRRLDLSDYGLTTLAPLAGMNLAYLDCSGNKLLTLDGIENLQLSVLICKNNLIEDISAIRQIPLKSLSCSGNRITDLSPAAACPLTLLDCSGNRIGNIGFVTDLPLERLILRNNRITDLTPLANCTTLRKLSIGQNPVRDLAPLADLPLERLRIDHTEVSDLKPLSGMPLTLLAMNDCPNIRDLSPIAEISTLDNLTVPCKAVEIPANRKILKELKKLKLLSCRNFISFAKTGEEDTPQAFWEKIEKKNQNHIQHSEK